MKNIRAVSAFCLGLTALFAQEANAFCQTDEIENRQRIDAAFDLQSGRLIYGKADTAFYQASMTKRIVELLVLEAVRDGRLKWDDMIDLPSVHLKNGAKTPVTQRSDGIPFEYNSISVRDGFIAGNRGSSNRFMQGIMIRLAHSEELGVMMINKRYEELGLKGQAQAAQVAGYPTSAMRYKAAGQPSNHFITPFAHALIVWKIQNDFAEEIKDLYVAKPKLIAFNSFGAHEYKLTVTSKLLPGDVLHGANEVGIKNLKTGYACGTGFAADYVAQVNFKIDGQTVKRDIVYVTAGHDSSGDRDRRARGFLTNLPEAVKEELKKAAENQFDPAQKSFAAYVAKAEEVRLASLAQKTTDLQSGFILVSQFPQTPLQREKLPAHPDKEPPKQPEKQAQAYWIREEDIVEEQCSPYAHLTLTRI